MLPRAKKALILDGLLGLGNRGRYGSHGRTACGMTRCEYRPK